MNKYILLIFSFLLVIELKAQVNSDSTATNVDQDTTLQKQRAVAPKPKAALPEAGKKRPFVTIDLGVDYLKLFSLAFPDEKKYEGLVAINFGFGMSIDGEYGYTNKSPKYLYRNGEYNFTGTYYRIGLSYNYQIDDNNTLGLGMRYAHSEFQDKTSYTIQTIFPGFNNLTYKTDIRQNKADWVEIVLKSEGRVKKIKNLKLGMFVRIKFINPVKVYEDYPIKAVPGYGYNYNSTASVNLFLKYSIPFGTR